MVESAMMVDSVTHVSLVALEFARAISGAI